MWCLHRRADYGTQTLRMKVEIMPRTKNKIGLGVITRRRPAGLRRLLDSFAQMNLPDGAECVVLIAENDQAAGVTSIVDALRPAFPFDVICVLEPELGIPIARNRVLDMAVEHRCDYLTFVDDDDVVHKDWLLMLHTTLVGRGFDLVGGGLLRAAPVGVQLNWQQRLMAAHHTQSANRNLARNSAMITTSTEPKVPVYTNNWMIRVSALQQFAVRFDETLRYTGGSDGKYFEDFVAAGGRTGWSSDARVTEIWSVDRLSFRYVYERARDQELSRRLWQSARLTRVQWVRKLVMRLQRVASSILRAPLTRFRSLGSAVHATGLIAGQISAAFGKKSHHYDPGSVK